LQIEDMLARAYDAPFDPPETVAEVVDLYQQGQLGEIWGLGPRQYRQTGAHAACLSVSWHGIVSSCQSTVAAPLKTCPPAGNWAAQ
jgi:hypothetical protein